MTENSRAELEAEIERDMPYKGTFYSPDYYWPPLWWRHWGKDAFFGFSAAIVFAALLNWLFR